MKRYLKVGFAELHLLVAACRSRMQESRAGFLRERTVRSRYSDLFQQRTVSPAEATILGEGFPLDLAHLIERRAFKKVDVLNHGEDVQKARNTGRPLFHHSLVPRQS